MVERAHALAEARPGFDRAAVVFAGTARVTLDASGFAFVNAAFIALWLGLATALVRPNRKLVAAVACDRTRGRDSVPSPCPLQPTTDPRRSVPTP